jgi:hypothetical protein
MLIFRVCFKTSHRVRLKEKKIDVDTSIWEDNASMANRFEFTKLPSENSKSSMGFCLSLLKATILCISGVSHFLWS